MTIITPLCLLSYLFCIIQVYATRYNPNNNSKLVLHVIYEMQKREAYRVDIVSERQAAIPGVLELAGNIGGP